MSSRAQSGCFSNHPELLDRHRRLGPGGQHEKQNEEDTNHRPNIGKKTQNLEYLSFLLNAGQASDYIA